MITIHPHTTGLDGSRHLICLVGIAGPHTCTKPVDCIVGDLDGFFLRLEFHCASNWSKDLLLEHTHVVGTAENCGLDVKSSIHYVVCSPTSQDLCALVGANLYV